MRELNSLKKQIAELQKSAAAEPPSAQIDFWGKPLAETPEGRRQALIDGLAGPNAPSCASEFGADDPRGTREHLESLSIQDLIGLSAEVARLHWQRTMTEEDRKQLDWFRSLPYSKKIDVLRSDSVIDYYHDDQKQRRRHASFSQT